MTCDLCGQNEATVHLTEIINDSSRELHLCETCAREKGQQTAQQFGLAELLGGLADFGAKLEGGPAKTKLSCPQCGMTYEDFRKSGRLGCGNCYEAFHRYLAPLLKRIHGSTQHVGRSPSAAAPAQAQGEGPKDELARLKTSLKEAVAGEAFEEAARLRDRVRALEAKLKKR
ncbi:MAG: UvrB/UvrC motif-containing protein [Candidatus Omnitrophica bacterium]|nr:UvrB/UvrC motif-containing protein [Candidatus Omnitrophota bacterium]